MAGARNPWEENYGSNDGQDSGAKPWEQAYQQPEPPKARTLGAVANDTVIEVANAAAGGVSAAANFVKPGNAVSGWIDKNIVKAGEDSQSDVTKAAKKQFRDEVKNADGVMGELGAVGKYVVQNPLLSAAQAAGSFVGPGLAVKATGFAGKAAQLGAKGVERAGRAGGVAAGAAMAGGDAAGTAYELSTKAGATEEQAVAAGRQASVIPAVIGGVGGMFGAEKLLAGAKGFAGGATSRALKTGASEAVQEGIEEGATQYEGQRAAMPYDPSIDPSKGVAAAAGMGTALGGITGAGASLLTGRDTGQQPNPGTQTPPGQTPPPPDAGAGAGGAPYQPAPSLTGTSGAELLQRQMDARNLDPLQAALRPVAGPSLTGLDGSDLLQAQMDAARQNPLLDAMRQDPVRAAVESSANAGGALSPAALVSIDTGASQQMADAVQAQAQADVSDEAAKGSKNAAQEQPVPLQPAVTGAEPVGSGALSPEERSGLATTIAGRELAGQPLSPEMAGLQAQLTQVQQRAAENGSWNVPLMVQRKRVEDAIAKLKPMEPPAERRADAANAQAAARQAAAAAQTLPAARPGAVEAAGLPPRGREGYDTPVTLDAASLKALVEKTRGTPLVDKPEKLEAWRNGTAKTDPAKFPIELAITPDGRLDVNDGRHRIALAAERGETVEAFIDGKDAQYARQLVSQPGQPQGAASVATPDQAQQADGVDQWRKSDETNTADLEEAKTISQVAMATLRNANARQKETERGSLEWAKYKLESEKAMIEIARANVLAYPFTAGPEYQKRVDNYEAFVKAANELESKIQAAAKAPQPITGEGAGVANRAKLQAKQVSPQPKESSEPQASQAQQTATQPAQAPATQGLTNATTPQNNGAQAGPAQGAQGAAQAGQAAPVAAPNTGEAQEQAVGANTNAAEPATGAGNANLQADGVKAVSQINKLVAELESLGNTDSQYSGKDYAELVKSADQKTIDNTIGALRTAIAYQKQVNAKTATTPAPVAIDQAPGNASWAALTPEQRRRARLEHEIATGQTNNGGVVASLRPSAIEKRKQELAAMGDAGKLPSPGPAESAEQRAQRVAQAGEAWTRMPAAKREALAGIAAGLNPIQRKRVPSAAWADLNRTIQRNLADAMGGREEFGGNQPAALTQQAQAATENVASTQPAKEFTGTKKGDFYEVEGDNAKEAARILDLTLTKSRAGVPIVGWPYHAHERNVAKLAESGISFKMEGPATHKDAGESPEAATQQSQPQPSKEVGLTGIDKEYARLTQLRGTKVMLTHPDGRILYDVQLSVPWRRKNMIGTFPMQRFQFTDNFEVKSKSDVTGNPGDIGFVLIDKRAQNAQRAAQNPTVAPASQAPAATKNVAISSNGQDEKAIRYDLPPEKSAQQQGDESWMAAQSPSFKPTARQQLLMDAVAKALDDGAFYDSDVKEHVAKALGVTPEQRARNSHGVEGGDFGYDVYGARKAVEAQRGNAKSREFAKALNLKPGDVLGTLIFNDGKVTTGVKVNGLNESGLIVTITGKRGSATLDGEVGVDRLAAAMDRAKERGKRKDGYAEFVAGRGALQQSQPAPATHADPGQAPEVATPAVVTDSLKKAARNEDTKPSEMRKWLVAEIDKELLQAADRPDYDEAVKRMGEKDAISMFTGNGWMGKNSETGFITFDVPGDGKYKVRNSVRGLLEFRKNVMASPGFKDGGQKQAKPQQNDGVQSGSGGRMAAIANMIEEGDFEAARDYAEAVGIKLEDVKVPRGDMKPAWDKYLKDGTLPPAPWMPSKEWQFQDIGASSFVPESEKRSATLTRVADGSTYVATVKGYLDGSSATYALTKDGKEVGRPSSRNSFIEVMRMAEDAMPKANDKPAPSKANDTGWNMAGTGYGGKRYIGRNITTADGREIVARVYENAGNYDEVEVKVDGVRKFTVRDSYNAQDKADAFIKTLTGKAAESASSDMAPEEAAKYLKDFVYSLNQLDGMTDRAQVLLSSPLGKSGRDNLLMEAFGLNREQAHDINNRIDARQPKKLRNIDMQDAFDVFPSLRKMVYDAIQQAQAKEQKTPPQAPAIPEGYKPAGEPFYRGGKQIQGYAPFTIGERVTMKDSAGQSGVIESLASPDDSGVFASAVVKFDNGMEQMVQFGKLEAAAPQADTPKLSAEDLANHDKALLAGSISVQDYMDATGLTDEDVGSVLGDGLRQQADREAKAADPYHQGIQKMQEALADQMRAARAAQTSTPQQRKSKDERIGRIGSDSATLDMIARGFEHPFDNRYVTKLSPMLKARFNKQWESIKTGEFAKRDFQEASYKLWAQKVIDKAHEKLGAPEPAQQASAAAQPDAPKLTPAEAKSLMAWEDLGQKDGVKTHALTFYESQADKDAKRGRMIVARVSKGDRSATAWMVDGEDKTFGMLAHAKKLAEEVGMARAVADGFVEQGDAPMFSRTGAKSPNAQQPTTRAWYDRFVSLLPASYRNDPHRREPFPAEDWNVQRASEVRSKVEALNKQLRGADDRRGYGPISIDGLGNLQVSALQVSRDDLNGPIKALAKELGAGIAITNVRTGDIQALQDSGFVPEASLAPVADRIMGRPFDDPANRYAADARAYGTIMTYKPRGFPAVLFSFAGARAATADKHALATAQQRLDAGEDAEAVRQDTGWFKGTDGKWRFEIDDSRAFLKGTGTFGDVVMARMAALEKGGERQSGDPVRLGDVLRHESLFAAYPALRDIEVQFTRRGDTAKGRLATDDAGVQAIHVRYELDDKEALSVLLHEIQHGIQTIEGFATGGTPQNVASILEKERFETMVNKDDALTAEFDALKRQYAGVPESEIPQEVANRVRQLRSEINAIRNTGWREASNPFARRQPTPEELFAGYTRLAGEVEARNTQARQKLTAEQRRATSPGQTADVADADVIVVFNGKEMANAPMPANAAPDAATTAQPLRTPAATIRAAITKAYGKLLGQLESKGLVTLTQTEDEAIEAAAQARAAKTGQSVEQARSTLRASVKNSVADQTQTENFQRWFKDSKVVDAEGKPLVVYHGTTSEFNTFRVGNAPGWGRGIYFTDNESVARDEYAGDDGRVVAAYVSLQNPYTGQHITEAQMEATEAGKKVLADGGNVIDASNDDGRFFGSMLRELGYDGVMLKGSNNIDGYEIVAFRPEQIKSATGNNGDFDPANPDIRRSADGSIQGFFDPQTGQSFLIADNLTAEAAPGVLMHEVGIHMAADGSMKALFNRAAMMLKLQRGNHFMKAVQARMDAAGETSGEEAAAYIAEAYENDRANAPASVQRWLADLLAAVKAWMFKKGIMGADRLTVADIAAVARANAKTLARGQQGVVVKRAMAAFSRDTNTAMTNNDVVGNQGGRFTEEQAAEEIANDDDLFNTIAEFTADDPDIFESKPEMARRLRSILAKVTPYEPWFKTYYRGEPSNSPATDRKRGFRSWSGNERTAKEFADEYRDGVVRQRSGKSRAVAISTIFTARMRVRDGESHYPGDQAESFILDGDESTAPDSGGAAFSRTATDQTQTDAFKRWFAGSRVVDADGKPLVVYHGTGADIAIFSAEKLGSNTGAASARKGFFFASNPDVAGFYSKMAFEDLTSSIENEWTQVFLDKPAGGRWVGGYSGEFVLDADPAAGREYKERVLRARSAFLKLGESKPRHKKLASRIAEISSEVLNDYGIHIVDAQKVDEKFLTENPYFAELMGEYAQVRRELDELKMELGYMSGANILPVYLKISNPLVHDFQGERYRDVTYSELISQAQNEGRDGVILRNTFDTSDHPKDRPLTDIYVVFDPEQIKSATGNRGTFDPANADIRFSRADMGSRAGMSALASKARDELNRTFTAPGKLSWWHKTVGTMYNLAERSPAFKRVFEAAQGFVDDVSHYATDAAELAPKLLPKLETWRDIAKRPITAADNAAVAKPVFEGTLVWTRDEAGKPVRVDDLVAAAEKLTAEQKARRLLRNNKISEGMLKAWQGLPLEQYEKLVASRYESQMLKAGIVWTPAELKSQFKLNDAQVALYQEFRAATDRSLDTMARSDMLRFGGEDVKDLADMVMDAASAQDAAQILRDHLLMLAKENPDRAGAIGQLANGMLDRAARVQELQEQGYAPLSRFGKYTVDVVNADGKREYFGLFETAREANIMAMKMRKGFGQDAVSQGTLSDEEFKLLAGITPESLELFGNMLGLDATGDDAQDQAFQEYLRRTKTNRSAMRRLIHRQGIAGYSEDVGRVLASFIYSNARQTSAGLHMGELGEAITQIPKQQGELKDAAIQLSEYVKNPQEEAQMVRGLLFAQYLGGSIASAFVNMTQPVAVSFPWLSQFGGAKQAATELGRAAKNLASRGHRYEADLAAALKHAEEEGTVSPQEVHQLMAQARGSGSLRPGDGTRTGDALASAGNALTRLSLAWGKVFGAAEQVNRRMTYIAAFRIAKAQKMANPAAFAKKAVIETQFTYSKANKMKWGRGAVGATVMTFKTYSIAYIELLHRMYTQGGPEGKQAVLLALAVLMLMGGAGGLPFAEDAEDLVDGLAQMMGYNFSSKKAKQELLESVFGEAGAGFVERGITGLPGMPLDVSGRLGMGNLLPGTGIFKEKTDHTRDVLELVGPVGDLAKRAVSGGRAILAGDVGAGLLQVSPVAVRNAAKGADMAARGMYRDDKGYKVIDTTPTEAAMKAIGFQPASVAKVQEANFINQQAKNFYNMKAQEIRAKWARGIFEKDQGIVAEARADLEEWNRKNPEQRIVVSMPAVLKRVREMSKTKDQRIADTAPKAMRQALREESAKARAAQ